MEYFDIINVYGELLNEIRSREDVHRLGLWHRAVHIWIYRKFQGTYELLLQKRSASKDSHPSCYDMSCAGHVSAGDDYLESAIRELQEELGVSLTESDIIPTFIYPVNYQKYFHDKLFIENELNQVYICQLDLNLDECKLQIEEVESLCWVAFEQIPDFMNQNQHCLIEDEVNKVLEWVNQYEEEKKTLSFTKKIS